MEFDTDSLNRRSIIDYLQKSGYNKANTSGKWVFFHSPFRKENNPSFAVNKLNNSWRDFGDETGGDLISLVMKIEKVDFQGACNFLLGGNSFSIEPYTPVKTEKSGISVYKCSKFSDVSLMSYMTDIRKINVDVVKTYCSQVEFHFPNSRYQKAYTGIGFQNDKGGWEIRNQTFKISSNPKSITTISGGDDANVFEGYIDFLSALTYFNIKKFKNTTYVLNGVGLLNSLLPLLKDRKVNYFGDNDKAGARVLSTMRKEGISVVDCRDIYEFYKDFNEFIQ